MPIPYLADENVLWVEKIPVAFALDHVDDARLQVEQQGSGDVVVVVGLVEEDVFAIVPLQRVRCQMSDVDCQMSDVRCQIQHLKTLTFHAAQA